VAKKEKDSGSSSSSDDSDSSSGSDSSSDDSNSDESDQQEDEESEEEEEVLKEGQLPKKYAFMALSHEQKTPEQRRWKWVAFDLLPEEMKRFLRPPKVTKVKDADAQADKKKKKDAVDEEAKETGAEIVDDRDLDYTKMEHVEETLQKYKNQQTSRKNFDTQMHI